jgi:putative amino-acid transport system substrate-binding protein
MIKNKAQSLLAAVAVAGLSLFITACGPTDNGQAGQKVLHIGSTGQSYPGAFLQDGKLVGYDVEVAETVAHDLGYQVAWTTADFSGLMGQLEAGKLDTIANNFVQTEKRKTVYQFSDSYLLYASQIVTSTNNNAINSLDDLKGKVVAGVLGSNHIDNLKKAFGDSITIRTYENRDGAMNDTLNGRVQGYVNSKPILVAEINKHHLPLKLVGTPISQELVSFPFAKNPQGDQLKQQFSADLQKMRADGRLKALSEKYFGEDLTKQ